MRTRRVVVHGATTELDPSFFGDPPSVETGRVVLSGVLTAGVKFDDGVEVAGIPWAIIEPVERRTPRARERVRRLSDCLPGSDRYR